MVFVKCDAVIQKCKAELAGYGLDLAGSAGRNLIKWVLPLMQWLKIKVCEKTSENFQ